VCTGFGGMQMSYNYLFDSYKNVVNRYKEKRKKSLKQPEKEENEGLRWLTNVDKDSLNLVKLFLDNQIRIRHLKNMPPLSFGVSDKEVAITIDKMIGGKMSKSFLISTEPLYVNHFNSLFDQLWEDGIDAEVRIRDIEEGIESTNIDIIENPKESLKVAYNIIKSAKDEVLRIYPSINSFRRQVRVGAMHLFREVLEHGVKVRILIPADEQEEIKRVVNEVIPGLPHLNIRSIDKSLQSQIGIIVVDRRESLIVESRDDTKDNYYDAAGLAAYSNSKPIALSYASIFENLWMQSQLYEQLKEAHEQLKTHDRMQRDFINIAAHELRTPIQPILGLAESARSKIKSEDTELMQFLDVISRNAKRLHRLTEDILDVTRIESHSLILKEEPLNLNELIAKTIDDVTRNKELLKYNDRDIKLSNTQSSDSTKTVIVQADKGRITQVIYNLLSNAVKFTNEGDTISIDIRKDEKEKFVIITVKDTGQGIDPEIFPRLFSKFATKSFEGTGLGLYISKSIVEAHGGRMWAENNKDGKGATFYFNVPLR
jgi:two-component system, OmpR family, sensor histidine kinase VicK